MTGRGTPAENFNSFSFGAVRLLHGQPISSWSYACSGPPMQCPPMAGV